MDDQATRLRKLVEGKTSYSDNIQDRVIRANAVNSLTQDSHPSARTIAITSGKGGVGKTNLAVNLAIAMGKMGKRVIVLDADMGMANVDVLLGTSSKKNLMDLLQDDVSIEDVLIRGPYGVSYISGGSGMEHAAEMTMLQQQKLFNKLTACDAWADIIIIDTGAGIGKNVLDFIVAADVVLLVLTPEPTSLTDAYAVIKAYSQVCDTQAVKLIVNKVFDAIESAETANKMIRTADRFLHVDIESIGYVCDDRHLVQAVRKQKPVVEAFPDSLAARCIQSLASNLLTGRNEEVKLGWGGFLRRMLQLGR